MARVLAVVEGDSVRIGNYGVASLLRDAKTNELVAVAVEVPDDVADQLEAEIAGWVAEKYPADHEVKELRGKPLPGKVDIPGRTDIRVERASASGRRVAPVVKPSVTPPTSADPPTPGAPSGT